MSTPRDPDHRSLSLVGCLPALMPAMVFAWFAAQLPFLAAGGSMTVGFDWVPSLGVNAVFKLDGLSALFGLIISGIGTLVFLYAGAYMDGHGGRKRLYGFLQAFLVSMLGLVLSDNLLLMFVFWELTTVFSFFMIGFDNESETARRNARQALLVTAGGGLFLLVGILLMGQAAGTYAISALSGSGDLLRHHPFYPAIVLCVLVGAFTKSAQMPFHFWLPNAMSAPTPVSAFLHSATMVKAGIYLLARLHPALGGTMAWIVPLVVVGAATAVWGSVLALGQTDLKRILAYTTLMALGIITMFLGGTTTPALTAAATFVLVHAIYKSALFMVVGSIDHEAGTRQLDAVRGVGRSMPLTAAALLMATFSMAGFPLFLGFIGKEIMYKGALTEEVFPELATTAALAANALMTAVAAVLTMQILFARSRLKERVSEAPWQMWCGPLLLSGIGLGFGLVPDWVGRWLIQPAVHAFHPTTEIIRLKLFYGINEPLLLSILTLLIGFSVYLARRRVFAGVARLSNAFPVDMSGAFERSLAAVVNIGEWQTRILQNGSLYQYLAVIISTLLAAVGGALIYSGAVGFGGRLPPAGAWQWLLLLVMLASVPVVARSRSRLLAICGMGVIGGGSAMIFLACGAPDLALTQLLVETLTLIIAAIVLLKLPRIDRAPDTGRLRRTLSLVLALGCGTLVTGLLMAVMGTPVDRSVTAFYEQASYLEAHGRNIVNVILVDFRSLDTLGEIVVVAASALAALALIRKTESDP